MTKKIIIAVVVVFVIMTGLFMWISASIDQTATAANARTEADFITQDFTVNELWEMQNKKNDQVLLSYLFIKPQNSDIKLRLPWEGSEADENALAAKIKPGQTITVKVLKNQLAKAQEGGAIKAITRFIMGDKREVTIFSLKTNNELLVTKDIHDYDEANITVLGSLINNPWIILVPFFIIIYAVAYAKRKKQAAKPATKSA
jgi:hypothetical protein